MTIAVGDRIPDLTLKERTPEGPADVSTGDLFKGKRVVLFAVPGAFTPTCSLNHLPGYLENRDAILAKGVDDIVVVAVNDQARAWGVSANELVKVAAQALGGSGGGKDDVAQGGGSDASRIDEALAVVVSEIGRVVGG